MADLCRFNFEINKDGAIVDNVCYLYRNAGPIYWPTFILAIIVALIASQSMISVTFAIISQSLNLGCFPRVKVIHTSTEHEGQVYIPDINYMYMIICVVITACFKNGVKLSNAYGKRNTSLQHVMNLFESTLIC